MCRESRYLLFLTENYVALDILKHYLGTVNAIHQLDMAEGQPEEMEPYILFGSSFPKDKEYTQVRFILMSKKQLNKKIVMMSNNFIGM